MRRARLGAITRQRRRKAAMPGSTIQRGWYNNPVVGNYAWLTIIHETGHLLGLKHPQDAMGSFGAVPANIRFAGILRDELSLVHRSLDNAGSYQRDLELSDNADDV